MRIDLTKLLVVLGALTGAGCGGTPTLYIANEHRPSTATSASAALDITSVQYGECDEPEWDGDFGPVKEPPSGKVTIPFGSTHAFELAPGCYDFVVTRGTSSTPPTAPPDPTGGSQAVARVVLDVGESATWVPFQIVDNENWW